MQRLGVLAAVDRRLVAEREPDRVAAPGAERRTRGAHAHEGVVEAHLLAEPQALHVRIAAVVREPDAVERVVLELAVVDATRELIRAELCRVAGLAAQLLVQIPDPA